MIVNDLSLRIDQGEILALVGESGSGKSMTAFSMLRLLPKTLRIADGHIRIAGRDVVELNERALRGMRGRDAALVFQEPMTSLNPLMTIGRQIAEMLRVQGRTNDTRARVTALLEQVHMPDAARRVDAFPHQLSGGLRQRAMIAMALAGSPDLLIADEPTTALDVTIQAQILKLLLELRERNGMAMLLITHDLGVVSEVADRVAVMYAGRVVETAPTDDLIRAPRHPYTHGLLSCLPSSDEHYTRPRLEEIGGMPPQPGDIRTGCAFALRCPRATQLCRDVTPRPHIEGASTVLCHHPWIS